MDKRGEFLVIGAVIMLIITAFGVYTVYDSSGSLYIGNMETKEYIDYFSCKPVAKNIPDENIKIFKSVKEAEQSGYTLMSNVTNC